MTTSQPPHMSPSPHLHPATLADLEEHLLDDSDARVASEHLADCATCQARRAALGDVRGLLLESAAVGPVPDDVTRRLDEAFRQAGGPVAAEAAPNVTPLAGRRRMPWNTRALQVAAVVVLLLALGGVGYSVVLAARGGSSNTTASTSGDSSKDSGGSSERAGAGAGGAFPTTESGRDYTAESLRATVPALVNGKVASSPAPRSLTEGGAQVAAPLRGAPLAACVANLTSGRAVTPLAVDAARYGGKPATILVLPAEDDPTHVDVFAVAPDCPRGTFLAFQRVARP
jgi:hypothetical protein